jgi:hypothetical protein
VEERSPGTPHPLPGDRSVGPDNVEGFLLDIGVDDLPPHPVTDLEPSNPRTSSSPTGGRRMRFLALAEKRDDGEGKLRNVLRIRATALG